MPIRVSLNGQQFFETGLDFQYYAHPTLSSIYPAGGVTVGATPVTLYGEGSAASAGEARAAVSWGRAGSGARHTTRARVLSDSVMECPSYRRARRRSTLPFSVALNGVDFVPTTRLGAHVRLLRPAAVLPGAGADGRPKTGGTLITLSGVPGFDAFDGRGIGARLWGEANTYRDGRRPMSTPVSLTADTIVCRRCRHGRGVAVLLLAVRWPNGVEYGVPQFVRFYDQPTLFVEIQR